MKIKSESLKRKHYKKCTKAGVKWKLVDKIY